LYTTHLTHIEHLPKSPTSNSLSNISKPHQNISPSHTKIDQNNSLSDAPLLPFISQPFYFSTLFSSPHLVFFTPSCFLHPILFSSSHAWIFSFCGPRPPKPTHHALPSLSSPKYQFLWPNSTLSFLVSTFLHLFFIANSHTNTLFL